MFFTSWNTKVETAFKFDLKLWTPSSLICQRSFETIYLLNMTLKMYSLSFSTNFQKKSNSCEQLSFSLYCSAFQKLDPAVDTQPYFVYLQIERNRSCSQCRINLSIVSTNAVNWFVNEDCTFWQNDQQFNRLTINLYMYFVS